jgi:hypothetical protein
MNVNSSFFQDVVLHQDILPVRFKKPLPLGAKEQYVIPMNYGTEAFYCSLNGSRVTIRYEDVEELENVGLLQVLKQLNMRLTMHPDDKF